jgi:hypothetical protein
MQTAHRCGIECRSELFFRLVSAELSRTEAGLHYFDRSITDGKGGITEMAYLSSMWFTRETAVSGGSSDAKSNFWLYFLADS